MHKFGFSDSVLDVAKAVLDKKKPEELEEAKMPRQMKDPKKETLMAYPYKPGKARVQVVDKKDVKDKEKKGYVHAEEVEEDARCHQRQVRKGQDVIEYGHKRSPNKTDSKL
jgi:hypothetical protein